MRSREAKRLEGELADARAQHASTRLALYTAKQAAAEQERRQVAAEARARQLQVRRRGGCCVICVQVDCIPTLMAS